MLQYIKHFKLEVELSLTFQQMFCSESVSVYFAYELHLINESLKLFKDTTDWRTAIFHGKIKSCFDSQIKFKWDRIIF